jgi:hypothetical protein
MVLDYATCNISMGSLSTPIGEQRVNIKFCVKLGKSTTATYSKCTVMKFYHVHVCLNGKHFREAWRQQKMMGYLAIHPPFGFLRKFGHV